jgi:hypothetical protein
MTPKLAIAVVVAVVLSGCARRVTLNPEDVAVRNSKDWTVKSEPGKAAVAAPAPAPAAQPAATTPAATTPSAAEPKKN